MAKVENPAKVAKKIVRKLEGPLPSTGNWMRITLYQDNSIRIERPYCSLDPRKEWPTLEETDAFAQRHLIGLLEPGAWKDISCLW